MVDYPARRESSQARLAAIIDNSYDAIISKTLEGTVTSWNRAAARIFGYAAAEAIGRPITMIIPEDRLAEEKMVLTKVRAGEVVEHYETVRRRKDGTFIDVSLTVSPIKDESGAIIGASKIARDISDAKRAERERARLLAEVQRANRAKDEFLAMLGHELRNPLGVILTAAHVLARGPEESVARRVRDSIERQAKQLARLVDDLVEVGRAVAGKIPLDRQPLDLGEAVCSHVAALRAAGKLDAHTVECITESVTVAADPLRLQQIVDNLIGNAIKYTPAGGTITIAVRPDGDEAALEVADSGIGIAPELIENVFDLFMQGPQGPERAEGGLGVGLTLVRRLVELHGGTIAASSAGQGAGSRFIMRLPSLPYHTEVAPTATSEPAASPRLRIVIVEDNRDGREMLRYVLEAGGHEVAEAQDGLGGVEQVVALRPDVALVDIGLPTIDGYEVARQIRGRLGLDAPVLVALTGYALDSDRDAASRAGFDRHLAKPVDVELLMQVLAEASQGRRREPGDLAAAGV